MLLALLWDYERRRGNILFEEISNETQWHLVQGQSDGASAYHSPADERPAMETRIIMRQFVAACEWPLVPGRYGGTVYAGLCLLLLVGPLILTRF